MINQSSVTKGDFILKSALILSVVFLSANFFLRLRIIPFYTTDTGGIEINVIDGIMKILSGEFLYTDPASPPFDIMQYSPLYYYLVAGLSRLFSISPSEPQNIFILSRLVALLSNLLLMRIIYLTGRHFSLSKTLSFIAAVFSFIILTPHYYSRGDGFYCLLFFTAVLFFIRYLKKDKELFYILFILLSFLSMMTKQSGIILPFSAGIYFLYKKRFRQLVILAVMYISMSTVFVLLSGEMGGLEMVYRNIVLGVKNGTSFFMYKSFLTEREYIQVIPWILLGLYVSIKIFKRKFEEDYFYLLILILLSLIFGFVSGLKIGSSLNYFVESFILIFIAGVVYFSMGKKKYIVYDIIAYFLITAILNTGALFSSVYISKYRNNDYLDYQDEKQISDFMFNEEKIKEGDLVYLNYRGYTELFLRGYTIMNQKDFNFYVHMYASPQIDYTSLIEQRDKGLIRYIVAKDSLKDVVMLGNYFSNFEVIKTIGHYTIYRFKKADS